MIVVSLHPLRIQQSYGKSPVFIRKSSIHGPFSIVMLNYQRVTSEATKRQGELRCCLGIPVASCVEKWIQNPVGPGNFGMLWGTSPWKKLTAQTRGKCVQIASTSTGKHSESVISYVPLVLNLSYQEGPSTSSLLCSIKSLLQSLLLGNLAGCWVVWDHLGCPRTRYA